LVPCPSAGASADAARCPTLLVVAAAAAHWRRSQVDRGVSPRRRL